MTSLVERMREYATDWRERAKAYDIVITAADRIEELERENAELRALSNDEKPRYTTRRMHYEIDRAKEYARREALEEAAKIADDYECHLMSYGGSVDAQHFYEGGMLDAGQGIAIAIRALSDSTPTPLQEQNANMGKEGEASVNSVESED